MFKRVSPTAMSLLMSMVLSSSAVHAADKPTNMQFGDVGHTNADLKSINHSGKLLLKKIKVNDSTTVNGTLQVLDSKLLHETIVNGEVQAKNAQFNELTVNGETELQNVVVLGASNINGKLTVAHGQFDGVLNVNGPLHAKGSTFKKLITVSNDSSEFEESVLAGITIQKGANGNEKQTLTLKSTKVSGMIRFESGHGIVKMDNQSSIGKVDGGTVEK